MTPPATPHLEAQLQRDIDHIRQRLLEMASLDERALSSAFEAFEKRDRQIAYSVILRDQDVDALETELDRLCLEFITRHQPAAGHLRFVYAASKIVSQLERVGDYAESVARQTLMLSSIPFEAPMEHFRELSRLAVPMLSDSVRAFADKNAELARATMLIEPTVNQVRDTLTAELHAGRRDGRLPLEALTPLITIARRYERVSDQATNICEEALYFATGEYYRHSPRVGFRVLFVDDGNGALSRLAEAAAGSLGVHRFTFASAGIAAEPVDESTAAFLRDKGIEAAERPPVKASELPDLDHVHILVALSPRAEALFSPGPSKALTLRWSVADPAQAGGDAGQVQEAYERAFASLKTHVADMVHAVLGNH